MSAATIPSTISPELMAEMQEAAENAAKGIRNPEKMREALERLAKRSAEIRQRCGVLDIGVPAIRELRGELPD